MAARGWSKERERKDEKLLNLGEKMEIFYFGNGLQTILIRAHKILYIKGKFKSMESTIQDTLINLTF